MKKNVYQKPTMKTVRLYQRAKLLAGSGASSRAEYKRSDYGDAETDTWY
jgi:hypothetical protein